jgi:hypothetical protein
MDNIVQLNSRRKDGFYRHCMLCPATFLSPWHAATVHGWRAVMCPRCYIRERFERTHNPAMLPYVLIASTPDGVEVPG